MKKQIEPGCMAVIIKSACGNTGKCVTVISKLGKLMGFVGYCRWQIDQKIITKHGKFVDHVAEEQLMRIDDFDESEDIQEKEEDILLF